MSDAQLTDLRVLVVDTNTLELTTEPVSESEVLSLFTDDKLVGELVKRGVAGIAWYCWVAGGFADVEDCRSIHPRRGCRPAYEMAVGVEVPRELWAPEWEPS